LKYCNLNGRIIDAADALVTTDNGAFRYGYGLFETMLVEDGVIRLNRLHFERLFTGLNQLYLDLPKLVTAEWLEEQVVLTVRKNNAERLCRVRLQVYAGGGGIFETTGSASFIIECFALEPTVSELNENGLVCGIADGLCKSNDRLSNLKSCNALMYAMAARTAKLNHWNDALICNANKNIIESSIANIFWITDGIVYTPPLTDGCVAGVMRKHLATKIPVTEKSLHHDDLMNADEVFLTNAIRKIRWVGNIGRKTYGNKQTTEIYSYL